MRTKAIAVFMAFGTKGDVYPIAAIATAFASDQTQYQVAFLTHSSHENLKGHLGAKRIEYFPISSPPVMHFHQDDDTRGSEDMSFSLQKKEITRKHRQECVSVVERIYGEDPVMDGDLIFINFFALEGWSLAELFHVRCVVAAPYVVPYRFLPDTNKDTNVLELFHLFSILTQVPPLLLNASLGMNFLFYTNIFEKLPPIGWEDVIHWMWPLFTEDWGNWRSLDLKLSYLPFTDPVTDLPTWHDRPSSTLLLYGFSQEVVECPGYWPSAVRVCGFWSLPAEWQFSCGRCAEISSLISLRQWNAGDTLCPSHAKLKSFLDSSAEHLIFISLSSVGSMGYFRNPQTFLQVLVNVLNISSHRFILFSAGYRPLDAAINNILGQTPSSASEQMQSSEVQIDLFDGRLFCFSGNSVSDGAVSLTSRRRICLGYGFIDGEMPYNLLFPRCAAVIHHGGSGTTAAALHAGVPQIICPFILDQFYWAERMFWLGVASEPLSSTSVLPDKDDEGCILRAANVLVQAINNALSPEVKVHATEIANRISSEDGVSTALRIIKEEIIGAN